MDAQTFFFLRMVHKEIGPVLSFYQLEKKKTSSEFKFLFFQWKPDSSSYLLKSRIALKKG